MIRRILGTLVEDERGHVTLVPTAVLAEVAASAPPRSGPFGDPPAPPRSGTQPFVPIPLDDPKPELPPDVEELDPDFEIKRDPRA